MTPIATATNTAGTPISIGSGSNPAAIAITPNGKTAYVANGGTSTVTPIATATNTPGTPIALAAGATPVAIIVASNGQTVYVTNFANNTR